MKKIIYLLLLTVSFQVLANEKPIQIIFASSLVSTKYGMSQQSIKFKIMVKKGPQSKNVFITLKNAKFDDHIIEATMVDELKDNPDYELWEAVEYFNSYSSPEEGSQIRSCDFSASVQFEENGEIYQDKKSTYHLEPRDGPMLIDQVALLSGLYKYQSTSSDNYPELLVYGPVDVMNLGHDKEIKIVYTLDDWHTTHEEFAQYNSIYTVGYSYFYCPNKHNVERWSFRFKLGKETQYKPGTSQVLKFYVVYSTDQQTYYDNNLGHNGHYELQLDD